MATYVISDIHGQYDMFMDLLYKISFSDKDTLYILGDIIDRGPHPIKTMRKLMEMPNVICLLGNHEYMALGCLSLFGIGQVMIFSIIRTSISLPDIHLLR